jgi:transposase
MVLEKKMSIRAACQELRIKPSTGKLIVKRFRTKGTYYEPKTQRKLSLQTKAQLSIPSEEEEEPAHQSMDFTN